MAARLVVAVVVFVGGCALLISRGAEPLLVAIVLGFVALNTYMVGEVCERRRNQKLNDEALEKAKASVAGAKVVDDKLIVPIHRGVNGVPIINIGNHSAERGS